ncbi:DUF1844 domain-containing protein [bacterium]|nr:DUF1844 domain-containing protein [bacterium]
MADEERGAPELDAHFFRLVATFEAAAMQQLGKIAHPITGDVELSLDGARESIDMLDMLKRKSDGNLSKDEVRFLDHVLYQLRMNYLETSQEQTGNGGEAGRGDADAATGDATDSTDAATGDATDSTDAATGDAAKRAADDGAGPAGTNDSESEGSA